jgi:hypothetical protein
MPASIPFQSFAPIPPFYPRTKKPRQLTARSKPKHVHQQKNYQGGSDDAEEGSDPDPAAASWLIHDSETANNSDG